MGFFNALSGLLDEDSDRSFEKRLTGAIDRVESALNTGLDKAENGIKKVEAVGQKADTITNHTETIISKVDRAANNTQKSEN